MSKKPFEIDEEVKAKRVKVLQSQATFDPETYEIDDRFHGDGDDVLSVRTTPGLVRLLESDKKIEVDARILAAAPNGDVGLRRMGREKFLEAFNTKRSPKKFREAFDAFATDDASVLSNRVGEDSIPLLGGPFNKQLYIYDYLKMHATSFHASNHDPAAKAIVNMTRDFTLGRGYRIDSKDKKALAIWRAFERVNNLNTMMEQVASQLATYGETMIWFLPDNQTKIVYRLGPGQTAPKGYIPRIRLIDPSVIWEVVTYPEDITRVLYYQWVAPTQYQMYTGRDQGATVPGSKFIYQQIPGADVLHYKVNQADNEKRGRSDLFPVLGYCKRLRDSVNYSIVGLQKSAAWSIDTTIEGTDQDLERYADDQKALGTIAPAGSEFIHTKAVTRQYLGNVATAKGGANPAFEWCLSMIAMGSGYPISYFGTHLSGGQTRASAIVATEPVAKKLEMRQLIYERAIQAIWRRLFDGMGMVDAECEVTFPEIIVGDRTAKLKDLALAETQQWISPKTAATIAAKELQVTEYEYEKEKAAIDASAPAPEAAPAPLSTPGKAPSALPSSEREKVKANDSQ